jgi:hypothetical protein
LSIEYTPSTITKYRSGKIDDPFLPLSESKKIINQQIQLAEIPVSKNGVTIQGYVENKTIPIGGLSATGFIVDYSEGIVQFAASEEGKTVSVSYMGRGNHYISSTRVWTQQDNGTVTETLADVVNNMSATESARVTAENSRVSAENARANNEGNRVNAENARVSAESTRTTNFTTIQTNMAIQWKGSVVTFAALPGSPATGDAYSVTADGTSSNNGFWRWSGTAWVKINAINPNGTALQSDFDSLDAVRADFERQRSYSGVVDFNANKTPANSVNGFPLLLWSQNNTTPLNSFGMPTQTAVINGYKISVNKADYTPGGTQYSAITLNAPPTYGYREDLVFLEAWFPTGVRGTLSWRIRVVDGVDFGTYSVDGFATPLNIMNQYTLAQGGAGAPMTAPDVSNVYTFYSASARQATGITAKKIFTDDVGLYIAGLGDASSKTNLATNDGYVYAIPLFRIKRRNSGGYRRDNLNGARDFWATTQSVVFSPSLPYGSNQQITLSAADYNNVQVGDTLNNFGSNPTLRVYVLSKDGSNKVTVMNTSTNQTTLVSIGNGTWGLYSAPDHRPDGLYSNIIDASDIIDLRHRIPVNFMPNMEVESTFDNLMRGALTTKDTKLAQKDVYGLRKAPLGLAQTLNSTAVKRADGTSVDLSNKIGVMGRGDSVSGWTLGSATVVIVQDGRSVFKLSGTVPFNKMFTSTAVQPNTYYLYVATVKKISGSGLVSMYLRENSSTNPAVAGVSTAAVSNTSDTTKYVTTYLKYQTTGSASTLIPSLEITTGDTVGQAYGLAVYQIDQATYNLIDVDANWTGGDKIGALFPYVDSYPNFVENLCPTTVDAWEQGSYDSSGNNASTTSRIRTINLIPVQPNTQYSVSSNGGSITVFEYQSDGTFVVQGTAFAPSGTFTTAANTAKVKIRLSNNPTSTNVPDDVSKLLPQLEKGSVVNPFVPYGRWYLDKDYLANGHMVQSGTLSTFHYEGINGGNFNGQRIAYGDPQQSITVVDVVDPTWNGVNRPKHVIPTQATSGVWAIGDTIKIHSDYGGITGATAGFSKILEDKTGVTSPTTIKVSDVSKFTASDHVTRFDGVSTYTVTDLTVDSVDSTNSTATLSWTGGAGLNFVSGTYLLETSSSLPTVTATGIAGTWSGLGTKDATYTITTAPTTNTSNITITYAVNYPAGKGLPQVATDILKAAVNGDELLAANTVSVKANFAGKVSGSTDLVPHTLKGIITTTSLTPSPGGTEVSQANYNNAFALDGTLATTSRATLNDVSQHVFQFDLIRAIEDKYGEIPADGTASKKTWLTNNITQISCTWNGYGSGLAGNKAYVAEWINGAWNASPASHTNGTVTSLTRNNTVISSVVDSNGFYYALAYADASDGVTASTINTDYVELSITLKTSAISAFDSTTEASGFTTLQPTNPFPVLSENMLDQNQAFPLDTSGWASYNGGALSVTTPGTITIATPGTSSPEGGVLSAGSAKAGEYFTATCLVSGSGTINVQLYRDSSVQMAAQSVTLSSTPTKITLTGKADADTSSAIRLYFRTPSVSAVTVNVSQIKLQKGVTATEWTPGRKRKVTLNFLGKVAGSTVEVPHRGLWTHGSTFPNPTTVTGEISNSEYSSIVKQDGVLDFYSAGTTGEYAQFIYEFDLSHLGMTTAQLKAAVRSMTISWTGYGSGDNASVLTNGATLKAWKGSWSTSGDTLYGTNTTSSPATISQTTSSNTYIDNNQKIYVLVHSTYPASATNPSNIYTDYVKLDVTLADYVDYTKSNIVKIRPETKEMKLWFPAKSSKYLGGNLGEASQVELWYRYVPYQGQGSISKSKILAVGTPIITTLGTGSATSDGDPVGDKNITTRLPSPTADYNLIADKFTSEGVLTTFDSLTLKRMPLASSGNYRFVPTAGLYFEPNSTTSESVVRGSTQDVRLSSDTVSGSVALGNYKFSIPTTLPTEALIYLPMLVSDSGELKLVVVSFRKSKSSTLLFKSTEAVYDHFKLAGRPLVKGV